MSNWVLDEQGKAMMALLPPYYEQVYEMQAIMQTGGTEIHSLRMSIDHHLAMVFVVPTDDLGLRKWEADFAIPAGGSEPFAQRKSHLLALLRGTGTVTKEALELVAQSYTDGEINIENQGFLVKVTFVGDRGVPRYLNDLKDRLRLLIPAHLELEFFYTYLTWDEVDEMTWSWQQLDSLLLSWDAWSTYKPNGTGG